MKLSWATLALLISIVIVSIFVANVANLINIDRNLAANKKSQHAHAGDDTNNAQPPPPASSTPPPPMGTGAAHLFWFLQISDLHISIFGDAARIQQFREFTTTTIDVIRPSVVLASGDLTDAKDSDHLGSRQYRREWEIYREILQTGNVPNRTVWLDLRGNHDNFNVPGAASAQNYFRAYSVQGARHGRSYARQVVGRGGERYTFVAVDACLDPGPKRPFNFIGVLSANDTRHLERLAEEAQQTGGAYTIWFGHYPTSCIVSMGEGAWGLRRMIGAHRESVVYMCGHLHQLGGAVPRMYTLQREGFLELELGDWKTNRTYRLAAIDHGMFSFVDVQHDQWPVVLVTNPKNAMYHLPGKERAERVQMDSTHIRLLVFSPSLIDECRVHINTEDAIRCQPTESPHLFVVPWTPAAYARGLHQLTVYASDTAGHQQTVHHQFSVDGERPAFPLLARIALMCDVSVVFRCLFAVAAALCVAPLLFFRAWHELAVRGWACRPTQSCRGAAGTAATAPVRGALAACSRSLFRRWWILATCDRLAVPLVLYIVYLCCAPWAYGEVIDGHWGWIFAWGIYVNGGYLPGSLTYLYGFFQLVMCQLPLMAIFARSAERRFERCVGVPEKPRADWARRFEHVPFVCIVGVELVLAVFFWHAYGALAFVCGPFRTWSVVLHVVLWWLARRLPEQTLRPALQVFATVNSKADSDQLPHRL